jgi:hypothetical protein
MRGRGKLAEVKSGFRLAGGVLLAFAWLVLAFSGLGIASSQGPRRPAVGWALLAVAAVVFLLTMDRWARFFPWVLAWGVFGGILTTASGHVVNHPEVAVPRWEGAAMTLLFATGALASQGLEKRRLRPTDRVALLAFASCVFWQVADSKAMLPALGIGTASLAGACLYNRLQIRRDHASGG